MNIRIDNQLTMELLHEEHAQELFTLTDINRSYLRNWLPWLDLTNSIEDTLSFIKTTEKQYKEGHGPQYALKFNGSICGVNGFHKIDSLNKIGSIGYWLGEAYTGKGIITSSTKAMLKAGYSDYALHKIEIHCAEENKKSRAIPERLGFTLEATLRDCELLNKGYVSHAIYSLLESEYNA